MSAPMWKPAVPAGQYAEHSSPADGPPRERRALQAERLGPLPGQVEGGVPPAQHVGRRGRLGVGQRRQHERLGVPERVPVVAGPGQALRADRPLLGPGARLQRVEQPEADRLLHLRVAVDPHVGVVPERVQVLPLGLDQARPSRPAGRWPGRAPTWSRTAGSERLLDQPYAASLTTRSFWPGSSLQATVVRSQSGCPSVVTACLPGASTRCSIAAAIRRSLALVRCTSRPPALLLEHLLGLQRVVQHRRDPRVLARRRQLLVGDQLGLQDQPGRARPAAPPRRGRRRPRAG